MNITINTRGFQDTVETTINDNNEVCMWHTYDGKDYLINTFYLEHEKQEDFLYDYAIDFIDSVYGEGDYEIIK